MIPGAILRFIVYIIFVRLKSPFSGKLFFHFFTRKLQFIYKFFLQVFIFWYILYW